MRMKGRNGDDAPFFVFEAMGVGYVSSTFAWIANESRRYRTAASCSAIILNATASATSIPSIAAE